MSDYQIPKPDEVKARIEQLQKELAVQKKLLKLSEQMHGTVPTEAAAELEWARKATGSA